MNKILYNTKVGLNKNECMNDSYNFVKDDNLIRTSLYLKNVKLK